MFSEIQGNWDIKKRQAKRDEEGGKKTRSRKVGKGEGGNLIPALIKPNLFWRATETAPCHYADLYTMEEEE